MQKLDAIFGGGDGSSLENNPHAEMHALIAELQADSYGEMAEIRERFSDPDQVADMTWIIEQSMLRGIAELREEFAEMLFIQQGPRGMSMN
ncbi:MAG: hypothetical protein O2904_03140 [bacterium]|nr:hypothetical protein [bacterium]